MSFISRRTRYANPPDSILKILGGLPGLARAGARLLHIDEHGLDFHLSNAKNEASYVRVLQDSENVNHILFYKTGPGPIVLVSNREGVTANELVDFFETETGIKISD
jgi:hypothetical protein